MPTALIYSHQLFKPSEVFVTQQGNSLPTYKPVYLGRRFHGAVPSGVSARQTVSGTSLGARVGDVRYLLTRNPSAVEHALQGLPRPDVIHAHFGFGGVYMLPYAKRCGIPLLTTFHGIDASATDRALLTSGSPAWVNFFLHRRALAAQGRTFICVSEHIRRKVLELGFPESRVVQHYIGVDPVEIRAHMQPSRSPDIIHIARLAEKKGTRYLIEAFAQIAKHHADTNLVIIGKGELEPGLRTLAAQLGVGERTRFLGFMPHAEVMRHLAASAILCLPSITASNGDTEGLGMVLLEAAALGLPVVGTQHGGIPEAVQDGHNGFLVPERDSGALAERLTALLDDASLRERLGKNGQTLVEEKFNIRIQAQKLEALYTEAQS